MISRVLPLLALALLGCATGCQTTRSTASAQRMARIRMQSEIPLEPKGDYFIARRYYKVDYKVWGYIRKPRESWSDARLVMLNENQTLAPDRAAHAIGSDNGYEYKVYGKFSGQRIYEPASNEFYPEFLLSKMELRSTSPAPIFENPKALDPESRFFPPPH
ncbi:MAG: hypothetical protein RLZZ244_2173 [Verrucomicrobiota bacterium]|jgi:hypothetical protein